MSVLTEHSARIHAKFFPPARPIVKASPKLWEPKPAKRRILMPEALAAEEMAYVPPPITRIDRVLKLVCTMYGITRAMLCGRLRTQYLMSARLYAVMRLSRECGLSTVHIGKILGRDHSTICNLMRRIEGVPLININGRAKRRKGTR